MEITVFLKTLSLFRYIAPEGGNYQPAILSSHLSCMSIYHNYFSTVMMC